ncbi:MAG: VWA domain-containing protein [Bacteroidota bacterium]
MVEFDHLIFLCLLAAIPVFVLVFLWMLRIRKKSMQVFGNTQIVRQLIADYSPSRTVVKFVLLTIAFAGLVFAVVNLKIGSKLDKAKRKGVDIIIALDVSNSMLAQDIKPSRIERAQMAISKLIDKFEEDQIGIVVFAGTAQVLLPITTDYASAKMLVQSASPDIIPTQGTAIGEAINLACVSFDKNSKNKKAIILISDGENHEDEAFPAVQNAVKEGIVVHTIGMGSENGSPIPVGMNGFNVEYKKDRDGNTVVTKLNEPMLQQLAAAGNGTYARASTGDVGLNSVFNELSKMEKKNYEAKVYAEYSNTFPYFVAFALLLLLIEFFIFERKTRLTRNLSFFEKKRILK